MIHANIINFDPYTRNNKNNHVSFLTSLFIGFNFHRAHGHSINLILPYMYFRCVTCLPFIFFNKIFSCSKTKSLYLSTKIISMFLWLFYSIFKLREVKISSIIIKRRYIWTNQSFYHMYGCKLVVANIVPVFAFLYLLHPTVIFSLFNYLVLNHLLKKIFCPLHFFFYFNK